MWKAIDYEEKYFDRMLEMIRENYGAVEIADPEFLKWQYFDNPAGKAVIKLAYDEENETLAGQYICIPLAIKLGNERRRAAYALDILTREEYRGQRIFTQLGAISYEECQKKYAYDFRIIFPNKNSRPGYIRNFGFKSICKLPFLVAPVCFSFKGKVENELIHKINRENVSLFDQFWKEIKGKYNHIVIRDTTYMKWRYLDIPLRQYGFYGVVKEGRLLGYVIGTIKKTSGVKYGVITDMLFCAECSQKDVEALIKTIFIFFRRNGAITSLAFFPEHSEEYFYLRKNGFFRCPTKLEPRRFEVLALDFEGNDLLKKANSFHAEDWFTTIGDYLLV